ncbi:MAG: leucine-rich repeat domain-containing protein [Oscillospiraceae bacterium]|nr:leucine-rich repeat domain-containing protein [Oscillospiraceae bacterium]
MKPKKLKFRTAVPIVCAAALTLSSCSLFGGSEADAEPTFDQAGYESRISELESQVEALRAETMPNVQFRNKSDFLLGRDNPAVSEAAAIKEEIMADLPPTIMIRDTEYSTSLTSLTLNNMGLTDEDIVELKYMVNLTELHIYQNKISDLTPLKGLTGLQTLSLFKNNVSDLSPIAGLVSLEGLYLRENNISDVSALENLTALEVLDISENSVSDITPLAGLRNLNLLRLNDNNITDIAGLSGLKNVTRLHLQNNGVTDITPVMGMEDLSEIYLENNSVSDVSPLMSLTSLGWIKLGGNPVENITPLTNLVNLKKLYVENTKIPEEDIQDFRDKLPDVTVVTQ